MRGAALDEPASALAGSRQQLELCGPTDRCPAVVHAELREDVLGMRAHGVQRNDELTPYSVTRIRTDHPFETMLAHNKATKGKTTQLARSTTRSWEGLRSVVRSKSPYP